jgi:hypothetical protein
MKPLRLAALALLATVLSCGDAVGPRRGGSDLTAARLRWRALDLHTYAITLRRSCFCANVDPLYVAVVDDRVAGVVDLRTGEPVDPSLGETVEDLFDFIETALERPAASIRATYDAGKGFPVEIDYDGAVNIADDEVSYRVSDLHPITPPL